MPARERSRLGICAQRERRPHHGVDRLNKRPNGDEGDASTLTPRCCRKRLASQLRHMGRRPRLHTARPAASTVPPHRVLASALTLQQPAAGDSLLRPSLFLPLPARLSSRPYQPLPLPPTCPLAALP
jgi:hypothetical protein